MIWMFAVAALFAIVFCGVVALGVAFAPALITFELCDPVMQVAHQREWYRTERAVLTLSDLIVTGNCFLVPYLAGYAGFTALFEFLLEV